MPDLQKIVTAAESAFRRDDVSRCIEILSSGLEHYPDEPELLIRLGRALLHAYQYPQAIAVLRRALALAPDAIPALYDLGAALRFEGNVQEALQVHERLRAAHPHLLEARFAAAFTRTLMGRPDEALPEMQRLLAEHPGDDRPRVGLSVTLIRLGRFTEALRLLDEMLEEDPDFVDALLHKSEATRHLNRTREWMEATRHAHEVFPDGPLVQYQMHLVRLFEGDARGAFEHLQRALALYPAYVDAHVALGNLLWLAEDLEPAQQELERAVTIAPWDGQAVGMLAHFQVATGRGQPDLEQLAREAQARPYAGLPYQLGRLYFESMPDPARAEHFLTLAVAHGPERVDALYLLGSLHLERNRTGEALTHFRRITELSPEHGEAWNGLALCLGREGRTAEALQAYAEAARLLPDEVSVFQGHGAALLEVGEAERALPVLRRALELQPESGPTLYLLATALEARGRREEALELARQAREKLPEDEDVRSLLARLNGSTVG